MMGVTGCFFGDYGYEGRALALGGRVKFYMLELW
jgi:hypothetical protein